MAKSRKQVKAEFAARGESIAAWARRNKFETVTARRVLNGEAKALYGESHRVAVALGIKDGVIVLDNGCEYQP